MPSHEFLCLLQKASAVDPSNLALEQDPSVSQPAKAKRLESCYVHLCDLLRVLKDTSGKKAPASLETFEKSLKREEKAALAAVLIRHTAASEDPILHESVYETLIQINCIQDLLGMGG
jgi:hypothetical protein